MKTPEEFALNNPDDNRVKRGSRHPYPRGYFKIDFIIFA